jgi:hypothetical protein
VDGISIRSGPLPFTIGNAASRKRRSLNLNNSPPNVQKQPFMITVAGTPLRSASALASKLPKGAMATNIIEKILITRLRIPSISSDCHTVLAATIKAVYQNPTADKMVVDSRGRREPTNGINPPRSRRMSPFGIGFYISPRARDVVE